MCYQTFPDRPGFSNSEAKLQKICLPEHLNGMSMLDLGCNEGFFCGAAVERGATRVVGIDRHAAAVDAARVRIPGAEFICADWTEAPEEQFDVVLLLSALHYAEDPIELMAEIHRRLKPDGLFILETGLVAGVSADWVEIPRRNDTVRHPSRDYLLRNLLYEFSPRAIGRSIDQAGDPVPRYVFHCRLMQPILMVITGRSGAGKSTLAREFELRNHVSCDEILCNLGLTVHRIGEELNAMPAQQQAGLGKQVALIVLDRSERMTVVDGYAFELDAFRDEFLSTIGSRRRVWFSTPSEHTTTSRSSETR